MGSVDTRTLHGYFLDSAVEQSLGSGPEVEKVIILSVLSGGQTTESEKEGGKEVGSLWREK